ncbi:hypothetical protein [Streptomyces sp. NPDC047061]|uniref:hypothetical protein n=1 Tax=Streptomyces sp. NPDC047061 TaxID=3154605 RepID=UPI0033DF2ABE
MRLTADGTTPVSRSVLANELRTDDGYVFELRDPLLLLAGDRIAFEDTVPVVTRASGERVTPAGDWSTRCSVVRPAG